MPDITAYMSFGVDMAITAEMLQDIEAVRRWKKDPTNNPEPSQEAQSLYQVFYWSNVQKLVGNKVSF